MNLVVYLPNFDQFLAQHDSVALERLCASANLERRELPLEAFICKTFGVDKQLDWPLAPIRMLGYGMSPLEESYVQLNLVHFSLQRDFFELYSVDDLSAEDSEALRVSINHHFSQSGFTCLPTPDPHLWIMPLKHNMQVATRLVSEVQGRDTRNFMPEGDDALALRMLMNEAQMLLYEHPVNVAREAQGCLAVNSVWFSGGGQLPKTARNVQSPLMSNAPLIKGLAQLTKAPHSGVPASFQDLQKQPQNMIWLDSNKSLDQDWMAPILNALKMNKLKRLNLIIGTGDATFLMTVKPLDLWKFWRVKKSLIQYFAIQKES